MHLPTEELRNPGAVAVIGASRTPGKIGNAVVKKLTRAPAKIYPVNPGADDINGIPCYPDLKSLPRKVDVAIICVPAPVVVPVMRQVVEQEVPLAIIQSGGFSEVGEEGARLEAAVRDVTTGSKTRVLGPNTLGVIFPPVNYDTSFVKLEGREEGSPSGCIGLISQSGSTAVTMMDACTLHDIGFSGFVGLGNRSDITEVELIEFFAQDQETRSIAVYLESVADGPALLEVLRRTVPTKPVVVVKAGRSAAGSRAAALHTGSLAGSDRVVDGALRQVGVHRAYDEEQLIDYARVLAQARPFAGRRIAILGAAGGHGVVLTDYVEATSPGIGLEMASFSPATRRRLRQIAVPYASVENPIDLTGDVTVEMYRDACEVLQEDDGIDAILMSAQLQPPKMHEGLVDVIASFSGPEHKPVVVSSSGGEQAQRVIALLQRRGVAAYPSLWRAVRALGILHERGTYLQRLEADRRG